MSKLSKLPTLPYIQSKLYTVWERVKSYFFFLVLVFIYEEKMSQKELELWWVDWTWQSLWDKTFTAYRCVLIKSGASQLRITVLYLKSRESGFHQWLQFNQCVLSLTPVRCCVGHGSTEMPVVHSPLLYTHSLTGSSDFVVHPILGVSYLAQGKVAGVWGHARERYKQD